MVERIALVDPTKRPPTQRWLLAGALFGACLAGRFALDSHLATGLPYLTFSPGVVVVALLCGTWPGIAMTVLSGLSGVLLFVPHFDSLLVTRADWTGFAVFVLSNLVTVGLIGLLHRAVRELKIERTRARELAQSRTAMFKELQHRVSNNLSMIASYMNMQRRRTPDESARATLDEAAARLATVSRLQRLLHDPSAQSVELLPFLTEMGKDMLTTTGRSNRVEIDVTGVPVTVAADVAVPVGLIATEMVANALEHAFADGRPGKVVIGINHDADHTAILQIGDDGPGLSNGSDRAKQDGLGLTVARELAEQIGGSLNLSAREEGGTVALLKFPIGPDNISAPLR
jgi:two-component system, sensor histidine kinase PdtaS